MQQALGRLGWARLGPLRRRPAEAAVGGCEEDAPRRGVHHTARAVQVRHVHLRGARGARSSAVRDMSAGVRRESLAASGQRVHFATFTTPRGDGHVTRTRAGPGACG
eukprot:1421506-Prymnesium_polylepis.1